MPPTGAKGLNLAVADVVVLARALGRFYSTGSGRDRWLFGSRAVTRVEGRAVFVVADEPHPSLSAHGRFDRQMQLAELEYLRSSRAARSAFAENYVGLPLDV